MSNDVRFQISVDMNAWVSAMQNIQNGIGNIHTDLGRLQQAERFTYFANDARVFATELANTNRVVAEQRELLRQLENYEKFLAEARKKTNDTSAIARYNSELARTRAAMTELRTVGGEALANLRLATDSVSNSAKKTNSDFSGLAKTVVGLASAYLSLSSLTDFAKGAITAANNYEQLNIAFTTILKSKAQADDLQAKIIELAAKTPYELPQLQETTKKLLAYGFAASEVIPTLKGIGDIAAGVGLEKLPQITNALGKMHAANRMMLGDVNSLTKAGVNILAELETVTGKSGAALRKYISQGNVTYDTAYAALMRIAKTDFNGLMEKQSQTVTGLFSTLKDNMTQASKTIGEGINERLKEVIRYWTEFLSNTSQEDLKKWGDRIGAAAVAISMLVANILQLLPSLTAMLIVIKLVQEWQKFDLAVKTWNETATGATGRVAFLKDGFSKLWTTISANPIGLMITAFAMLLPVAQLVYEKLTALSDREKDLNQNIKDVVQSTSIQINESSKLFAIVRDGTSTKEQHAGAVKKLLELSKEHGTGIETEAQLLGNLTNAEKLLTDAIIENGIARQKNMVIQKMQDDMSANEIKILELQRKREKDGAAKEIYNAETNETVTYDPYLDAIDKLKTKNAEIAEKGKQAAQDVGTAGKAVKEILKNTFKEPFSDLNNQIKVSTKNVDAAQKALEVKKEEIAARIEGMSEAQQKVLMKELKPFEDEVKRLENNIRMQKAELNRDKDAAVGIGGKKHIQSEISDPKAERAAKKAAKDAENDAKRRENEAWSAKQKLLDLDIRAESDAAAKQKLQAKKGYDEYLHELEKFHKDKAFSDSKYNEYKKSALDDYNKQIANIEIAAIEKSENEAISREKRGAKLIADNRLKELKVHEIAFNEAKLKANRELKDNQTELATELLGLEKDFSAKRFEINQSHDKKDIESKFKIEKEKIDLLKANFDLTELETRAAFEKSNPNKRQRENFEKLEARNKQLFQLEIHKTELKLEKEQQISLAKIGIEGAGARVELLDKQIKSVNAQIETVKITPLQNSEGKKFDLWRDVFGLDPENDKDAQRIKAIKKAGDEVAKLANQYLANRVKNAEKELKLHDDAVKKAEDRVKKEKDLKDKGLANDLETAEKALSKEKELQAQALAEKQKVQKQQLVLESIGQFSSLVSASANIYKSMSPSGPIGIGIAVATIAAMFGSFALAKKDAYDSITKYEKGKRVQKIESGLLKGRSHSDGGVMLEAEGGEWIVNKIQSEKFNPELDAINSGNEKEFARLAFLRFANMGTSFSMPKIETAPKLQTAKMVQLFESEKEKEVAAQKTNESKLAEQIELTKESNQLLREILKEIPAESTDLGDYVQKKKGNRIETIRKFKKTE